MSFYTSNNVFIPGGNPGSILFVDPASPNPGAVTTDTFFRFDPTNDRLIIWGNIGAGIDIGTGNMRVSLTGNAGIGIGTQAGTSYFNIGTGPGAVADIRGVFSNLGIGGTSSNSLIDVSGEWNTTGTPTGIRLNVTDTASNANSLLMDLQVGGTGRFRVTKNGWMLVGDDLSSASSVGRVYLFKNPVNSNDVYLYNIGETQLRVVTQGSDRFNFSLDTFIAKSSGSIGFSPSANVGLAPDVSISRDAANTLAQRNGVNAQTFRVYNTFTDASNYERGGLSWSSNELVFFTGNAGTGLARNISIVSAAGINVSSPTSQIGFSTNGLSRWTVANAGHLLAASDNTVDIGASGANRPRNLILGSYQEMSEMTAPAAPAANSVRIYAEDNGSGKTRLMARFATGAAQQIAIEP